MKLTIVTILMSILAICVTSSTAATNDAIPAASSAISIEKDANIVADNMKEEQKTNLRSSNGHRELNQCASPGSWCFLSWHCCDSCVNFTCCNKQAGDWCTPHSDTCCGGTSCKHVGTDHDQLMWRCL